MLSCYFFACLISALSGASANMTLFASIASPAKGNIETLIANNSPSLEYYQAILTNGDMIYAEQFIGKSPLSGTYHCKHYGTTRNIVEESQERCQTLFIQLKTLYAQQAASETDAGQDTDA